jgi:DNA-directed RNA polymerase subunit L
MSKVTVKKNSKKLSRSNDSKNLDIKIKEIKYQKHDDLLGSYLTLEFSGSDINTKFVNALRRVSMDDIPIYGFPAELINIEANTTIFNNDYMRLRLSQLPIFDVDSDLDYLERKYENAGLNLNDINYVKYEKQKLIEVYINSYNNTPENINITTNDINYLEDGEPVEKYSKKYPILLVQLRPNETFKAHMKAGLSNGMRSNIFAAASNCYYDDEDGKILFTLESQGQINEYKILEKSCRYILKKLDDFKENFEEKLKQSKEYEKNSTLLFEFDNEDHTMGEILNTVFQDNPKVLFSGLSKMSPLERKIRIKIASEDSTNPLEYMIESVQYLVNVYNQILKELKK